MANTRFIPRNKEVKVMKKLSLILLSIFLIVSNSVAGYGAAEISGTIYYTGAATGTIIVVAFSNPQLNIESALADIQLDSLGSYTISDLPDGTYYIVSVLTTLINGNDIIQKTDPLGVYGTWGNPTPVTITGGMSVSGIDITLIDCTEENPNPYYREEGKYHTRAHSQNWSYGENYQVQLEVEDSDHSATSVEITGPGISGSIMLDYDNSQNSWNSWHTNKNLDLGSSPPTPPLTYTFTIVDPEGTTVEPVVMESFVTVYAANLSPSNGETITDPVSFSWTGVGPSHTYLVQLSDAQGNRIWNSNDNLTTTSVSYNGPDMTPGAEYSYDVVVMDKYGNSSFAEESFVYQSAVTGIALHPSAFYLSQNFPNPFNPVTTIEFSVPLSEFVTLRVFNMLGEEVATLVNREVSSGSHTIEWDASGFASGLYFYRLEAGSTILTRKLLLMK